MKIKELHFLSDNLSETETFYNNILELKTNDKNSKAISFYAGKTLIVFNKSENKKPIYHFAFDIPHSQFEEAMTWSEQRMELIPVTTDSKVSELKHWNSKSIYFYDNNGNLLEFIARADIEAQPTIGFSGESILHVSEIGIVSDNVATKVEELKKTYTLDFYIKQPPTDKFMVLGDETGLLVNVETKRNWFPTSDLPAKPFWTKVVFEAERGIQELIENE